MDDRVSMDGSDAVFCIVLVLRLYQSRIKYRTKEVWSDVGIATFRLEAISGKEIGFDVGVSGTCRVQRSMYSRSKTMSVLST